MEGANLKPWIWFWEVAKLVFQLTDLHQHRQGKLSTTALASISNAVTGKGQSQLSFIHDLRTVSATPMTPEPALLCCPGEVQGPLSGLLQLVRGRSSFSALMTPGTALDSWS